MLKKKILLVLTAVALVLSCSKEAPDTGGNDNSGTESESGSGSNPGGDSGNESDPGSDPGSDPEKSTFRLLTSIDTRTVYNPEDNTTVWEDGDELSVIITPAGGTGTAYRFTRSEDVGNAFVCADFTPEENVEYTYSVLYPYVEGLAVDSDGYTVQALELPAKKDVCLTQSGTGDASHVKGALYGNASSTGYESPLVRMAHLTHLIKAEIANNTGVAITVKDVTIANDADLNIGGTFHVNLSTGSLKAAEPAESVRLGITDGEIAPGKTAVIYVPTPEFTVSSGRSLMFTVEYDSESTLVVRTAGDGGIECKAGRTMPAGLPVYFSVGNGTETHPYQISNASEIRNMEYVVDENQTTYFKMTADVDMKDITDWVPLNYNKDFTRKIIFDGCGHTISNFTCDHDNSYGSFFGVLYGECRNVRFLDAHVTNSYQTGCGIIGGYVGTSGKPALVENCHIHGVVSQNKIREAGGVAGSLKEGTIRNCYIDVNVEMKQKPGNGNTNYGVGGVVGKMMDNAVVEKCFVTVTTASMSGTNPRIYGSYVMPTGGIAGNGTSGNGLVLNKNISWIPEIWGLLKVGAVCGTWTVGDKPTTNYCRQQNIWKSGSLLETSDITTSIYCFAEYGKNVSKASDGTEVGGTVTDNAADAALSLDWDTDIWDLGGTTPELKLFKK